MDHGTGRRVTTSTVSSESRVAHMGWLPSGRVTPAITWRRLFRQHRLSGRTRPYATPIVIDQDADSRSVAYAMWHALVAQDRECVALAPAMLGAAVPGDRSGFTSATVVRTLTKAGLLVGSYRTRRVEDVQAVLARDLGPMLLGCGWSRSMLTPRPSGFIVPHGPAIGGHCCLIVGYSADTQAFRLLNSWGSAWGQLGRAWIEAAHLRALLVGYIGYAEAVLPILNPDRVARAKAIADLALQDTRGF